MAEHWASLRAALLALFVAGLIWIWAEGESLTTRTLPHVQIELPRDLAGEYVVQPDDPTWTGIVQVRLEGPVRSIESAAALIGSMVRLPAGLDAVPKSAEERGTIRLGEAIASLPELANLRGIVAEIQPPELNVRVLHMVNRELPIRVELARDLPLDGEPIATPTTALVRLPGTAAAALGDQARLIATISEDNLARVRNEGPQSFTVALRLPAEAGVDPALVVIRPETISVSLRPKQALDSLRLPNVPVWFSLPPTEDGAKWNVEVMDKFLTDVTVTGPSDEIKRIKSGALAVKAMVELATDDLEKGLTEKAGIVKQATFVGLGPGVTCTVANATVKLRITNR